MKLSLALFISVVTVIYGCSRQKQIKPNLSGEMPQKMLWAWERPEDLRFIDTKQFGVAFLAQTIFLDKGGVSPKPRRQPLELAPGTYLIAVTRIETKKGSAEKPDFSPEMATKVAIVIMQTLDLPDVKGIQIDFDAVSSERAFYREMMNELAKKMRTGDEARGKSYEAGTRDEGQGQSENPRPSSLIPHPSSISHPSLTMTSLASWCTGDAWFNDFPVDEAVPMAFQMGADEEKIKTFLRNGNDWREPLCRGSYGLSLDDPLKVEFKSNRRTYYFSNNAWQPYDLRSLQP